MISFFMGSAVPDYSLGEDYKKSPSPARERRQGGMMVLRLFYTVDLLKSFFPFPLRDDWAAARRAMGTLYGEQLT